MMTVIKCKSGKVFSASVTEYIDTEWKVQELFYKAQGCKVSQQEKVQFESCECEHCKSLNHDYETLIDELRTGL